MSPAIETSAAERHGAGALAVGSGVLGTGARAVTMLVLLLVSGGSGVASVLAAGETLGRMAHDVVQQDVTRSADRSSGGESPRYYDFHAGDAVRLRTCSVPRVLTVAAAELKGPRAPDDGRNG